MTKSLRYLYLILCIASGTTINTDMHAADNGALNNARAKIMNRFGGLGIFCCFAWLNEQSINSVDPSEYDGVQLLLVCATVLLMIRVVHFARVH